MKAKRRSRSTQEATRWRPRPTAKTSGSSRLKARWLNRKAWKPKKKVAATRARKTPKRKPALKKAKRPKKPNPNRKNRLKKKKAAKKPLRVVAVPLPTLRQAKKCSPKNAPYATAPPVTA